MAFGMRKALQAEQSKSDMENRTIHLEGEKNDLERQIAELKAKCVSIETREGELRQLAEQKHQEDVAGLMSNMSDKKKDLQHILNPSAPAPAGDKKS